MVAFYILYKVYNNENFKVTPFESVVLSSINQCMQIIKTQPDSYEAHERKAEYSLLSDFILSTPKVSILISHLKIGSKKVCDFIKQIEKSSITGKEPNKESHISENQDENAAPVMIPMADIRDHIKTHKDQMPTVTGPKAFALAAPVVLDEPDVPDNSSHQMIN